MNKIFKINRIHESRKSPVYFCVAMIDSHQHFWQVGRFDYPWLSSDLGVLYRDYLPADLAPVLGMTRTVLVQASNSIAESRWLLDFANENGFIAGVVGWVDLTDPDAQLE